MTAIAIVETKRTGGRDKDGHRTYTREFFIESDIPNDGSINITSSPLLPQRYSWYILPFEFDSKAWCVDVQAVQRKEQPYLWDVVYTYKTDHFKADSSGQNPSDSRNQSAPPELRPPHIKVTSVRYDQAVIMDEQTSKPIQSSSGEAFDPPFLRPMYDTLYEITFWRSSVPDFANVDFYPGTINNDMAFMMFGRTFGQYCLLCTKYDVDENFDNGYYTATYVVGLQFHNSGHLFRPADSGTREKVDLTGGGQTYRTIVDDQGKPITSPVLLNGAGQKLTIGADPYIFNFNVYPSVSFASIFLP